MQLKQFTSLSNEIKGYVYPDALTDLLSAQSAANGILATAKLSSSEYSRRYALLQALGSESGTTTDQTPADRESAINSVIANAIQTARQYLIKYQAAADRLGEVPISPAVSIQPQGTIYLGGRNLISFNGSAIELGQSVTLPGNNVPTMPGHFRRFNISVYGLVTHISLAKWVVYSHNGHDVILFNISLTNGNGQEIAKQGIFLYDSEIGKAAGHLFPYTWVDGQQSVQPSGLMPMFDASNINVEGNPSLNDLQPYFSQMGQSFSGGVLSDFIDASDRPVFGSIGPEYWAEFIRASLNPSASATATVNLTEIVLRDPQPLVAALETLD